MRHIVPDSKQPMLTFRMPDRVSAKPVRLDDTWSFDGSTWTEETPATRPPPRTYHAMVHDLARRRTVMVAGDTWFYGDAMPAGVEAIGTGCAGSKGVPVLDAAQPWVGHAGFTLDLLSARASTLCVVGLDATSRSLGLGGGCILYLGLQSPVLLGTSTNAFGFASVPLPIPFERDLRGGVLYAQGFVADPNGPALGLALTGGVRITVGD